MQETPVKELSKTDRKTVEQANSLLSNLYTLLPNSAVRSGDVTKENIDSAQSLAEQIEALRIYKRQNPTKLHWQTRRAFGRLKGARAVIDYPHQRQVEAAKAASSPSFIESSILLETLTPANECAAGREIAEQIILEVVPLCALASDCECDMQCHFCESVPSDPLQDEYFAFQEVS